MTTFPRAPRLQKGAIVGLDSFNPLASVIVFQYNPDTLTRTVRARAAGEEADRREALRLQGPPRETISLEVEIDATDQLERGEATATSAGIHPALASLEMLLYPKSALVVANEALARLGVVEVIPPEAPLTLLIWGSRRVVPVRLEGFTITEEAFDPDLNPIRARVGVELQVLSYQDLGLESVGGGLFMAHQVAKEVMATVGGATGLTGGAEASVATSFQARG